MKRQSHLDTFLRLKAEQGKKDSEGVFTLAAERALAKLSQNSLPFESAWTLKLVQAAVAARALSLSFSLFYGCVDVTFEGQIAWTAEALLKSLGEVDPPDETSTLHLLFAMRDRLSEEHKLLFVFEQQVNALFWNGTSIRIETLPEPAKKTILSIRTEVDAPSHPAALSVQAALNALFFQTLADSAHMCPIPLKVDGQWVNSLFNVARDGSAYGIPLVVGWDTEEEAGLNFVYPRSKSTNSDDASIPKVLLGNLQSFDSELPYEETPFSRLWILRANYESQLVEETYSSETVWESNKMLSTVNFVRDGVIVDQHALGSFKSHVSLDLYISADGLKHDLTSFALLDNESLRETIGEARQWARDILAEREDVRLQHPVSSSSTNWIAWFFQTLFQAEDTNKVDSHERRQELVSEGFRMLKGYL